MLFRSIPPDHVLTKSFYLLRDFPGRWIDLTTAPLSQQIIAVVADAGGAISKDDLVRRAWGEPDYHPLRHDKRMQIAVHRLRRQIEDDPAVPRRLITTPDGYALGAGFRRIARSV